MNVCVSLKINVIQGMLFLIEHEIIAQLLWLCGVTGSA